jgi:hypothetical protein
MQDKYAWKEEKLQPLQALLEIDHRNMQKAGRLIIPIT